MMREAGTAIRQLWRREIPPRQAVMVLLAGIFLISFGAVWLLREPAAPLPARSVADSAGSGTVPLSTDADLHARTAGAGAAGRHRSLVSPFDCLHGSRAAGGNAPAASSAKRPGPAQPAARQPALPAAAAAPSVSRTISLTGIVRNGSGAMAILSLDGQQLLLCPGETAAGITLVSLTDSAAVIQDADGERELYLGK